MIISRSRNFIFLHACKTAGSSISLSLAKNLSPDDIMIGCWVDARRNGIPYNRFARRVARKKPFTYVRSVLRRLRQTGLAEAEPSYVNQSIKAYFYRKYGFVGYAQTPAKICRQYDPGFWDSAFKFAFVRNPWTQVVSHYWWCARSKYNPDRNVSFKEFLRRLDDPNRPDPQAVRPYAITNWDVYTIDDRIAVDYLGRYETLEQDLKNISRKLGFEVSVANIRAKAGVRPTEKSIAEHYDDECVELVRKIFRKEIEAFSYQIPF